MTAGGTESLQVRFRRPVPLVRPTTSTTTPTSIVVGAGPSGSSAAYWLATAGLDVLLLEKTTFPREKVCGDGLTPRGTRALIEMGIDVSEEAGWLHNQGLRVIGGGQRLHLDWPELTSFPNYGLVRPARRPRRAAGQAGGQGRRPPARADHRHRADRSIAPAGSSACTAAAPTSSRSTTAPRSCSPARVSAASWRSASACTATTSARWAWPSAATTPARKTHDDYLESWLELWDGAAQRVRTCCPATAGSSAWATAR